ncbi:MAG: metalloregulator ArsR/SmtB family transcription factor [Caulobacteraceae bacterium]|nr:metalloregulator ArsR/SmtB family transcription factor [Caulobacteraceae bacterium]
MPPELVNVFKALAHESRLRLLGLVAQREHSVQELAAAVGVSEPTASHHLALLRDLGLVSRRVEGNTHWYGFEGDALRDIARQVLTREGVARLADQTPRRDSPEAVITNFIDAEGRLTQIPAARKKRHAVLAWLVRKFDDGRRYPERELNEMLLRFHWDSATLRREFIGYRMMARERGVYWRLPEADWRAADSAAPID